MSVPCSDESYSTSNTLLSRVRTGKPLAWQTLCRLYGPLVYRWARQCSLQDSDAADVTQEVFHAVFTSMGGFRWGEAGQTFRGWLWTITRNEVRQLIRRARTQPRGVGGTSAPWQELPDDVASDVAPASDLSQAWLVHQALKIAQYEFEPRTWQAFWQVVVAGRMSRDVAADLGLSDGDGTTGQVPRPMPASRAAGGFERINPLHRRRGGRESRVTPVDCSW